MVKGYLWEFILAIKKLLFKAKINKGKIKTIILFCHGGIGNLILLIPSLYSIRKYFNKSCITLISPSKINIMLIQNTGLIDKLVYFDYNKASKKDCVCFFKTNGLINYDLGISFSTSKGSYILRKTNIKIRLGYDYGFNKSKTNQFFLTDWVKLDYKRHETDQYFNLLKLLDMPIYKRKFLIYKKPIQKYNYFYKKKSFIVGMHPGTSKTLRAKQWPIENFLKIAEMLFKERRIKSIIFGGKDDKYLSSQIIERKYILNLIDKSSLPETAYLISMCNLFLTNDSGLMHLAAALNIPLITFFGPTDISKNKPVGKSKIIIINNKLNCSPCYKPYSGKIECKDPVCLTNIQPQYIYTKIKQLLSTGDLE